MEDMVKDAIETMIAGVLVTERGMVWRNGYIKRSGDKSVEFYISQSVIDNVGEEKAITDAILVSTFDVLLDIVEEKSLEAGSYPELKTFYINEARLMRGPLDDKTKKYKYELMFTYFHEIVNNPPE